MLVTFSCDAHENITMFGDDAVRLIKMMGHSGTVPSALMANDVPNALVRLEQAVEKEKSKQSKDSSVQSEYDEEHKINLSQRAWPLLELLRDAARAKCKVMWKQV